MRKIGSFIERRRALAGKLKELLDNIPGVINPTEPAWGGHIYQSYVITVDDDVNRDLLIDSLREKEVETTLGTYSLSNQPFFQREYHYQPGQLPNAHAAFHRTVTLPLYPQMEADSLHQVAAQLRAALAEQ
jgi:dTDP-4-amino-4,6-dideoxygalactose transaminase